MKTLFLIFHGFAPHNGISKKIYYQIDALRACGVATELCHLEIRQGGEQCRMIDDRVLDSYGSGVAAKIKKRTSYGSLTKYIIEQGVELLYIRSAHNANPFINNMLRRLHKAGVKIALEIPTYPYEGQFKASSVKDKLRLRLDIMCRMTMAGYIDRVVTFTEYPTIFGVPTITISNGIDFDKTRVKAAVNDTSKVLKMIGVAELHYWHAFDRMIRGMADYYAAPHEVEVEFHIVGHGVQSEVDKLKAVTEETGMADKVIFHGVKSGEELDSMFDVTDMGVASLGRHRSGNTRVKTLKNREYAARGIPFIYSETDEDFDTMPYVMKAPADETPVDVGAMVKFYRANTMSPTQIRGTIIETLSWRAQMQRVVDEMKTIG